MLGPARALPRATTPGAACCRRPRAQASSSSSRSAAAARSAPRRRHHHRPYLLRTLRPSAATTTAMDDGPPSDADPLGAAADPLLGAGGDPMDADAENGGGARLAAAPPPPRRPVSPPAAKKDNWALRSVLKIFVARIDPNYGLPWQKSPQRTATGSGFVVDVAEFQDVVDLSEVGVGAGAAASGEGDDAGGGGASAATKTTTATGDLMILTNAHVVSNAVTVYVRRPGSAKKWPATVACVARQCDLALLRVADRGFWGGGAAGGGGGEAELPALRPLHFAARVPQVQENLVVAGYPTGGDALSLTSGIVSRVAMVRYSAYGRLIGVQTDSAINPGNSGGPAFSSLEKGIVVGVAFSKNVSSSVEAVGYCISDPVVRSFMAEFRSFGNFRGLPSPGFATQPLENEAAALALGLPKELAGVRGCAVTRVDPLGSAGGGKLRVGDVIDSVDGVPVAADESIAFRGEERLDWTHLVLTQRHVGQRLRVAVWRQDDDGDGAGEKGGGGGSGGDGDKKPQLPPPVPSGRPARRVELELTLLPQAPLVPLIHGVDATPSYLVFGGVVFCPLSLPALEAMFGRRWRSSAPVGALAALSRPRDRGGLGLKGFGGFGGEKEKGGGGEKAGASDAEEEERQQVVVVSHVLAHEVNHGLSRVLSCTGAMIPIDTFEGEAVHSLRQLARRLDGAMAEAQEAVEEAAAAARAGDGDAPQPQPQPRRFVTFGLNGGPFISMDCIEVLRAQAEILEANSIARDRSADLVGVAAEGGGAGAKAAGAAAAGAAAAAAPKK